VHRRKWSGLRQEIESLIDTHQDEIGSLQNAISTKSSTIQQKESNLTVIGTYVDKLEERLAIAVAVAISRFASGNVKSSRQR
jgi:hypothetical protein